MAARFVAVHHPAVRPQRLAHRIVGRFEQQVVVLVPPKPALRGVLKRLRQLQAARKLPCDFQRGEAVPHRVQQIQQHIVKIRQALHIAAHLFRQLRFGSRCLRRLGNLPVQAQHRHLARLQGGRHRRIALLNVQKQLVLRGNIAALRVLKQQPHLGGRNLVARVLGNHAPVGGDARLVRLPGRAHGWDFCSRFVFFCHDLNTV